MPQHIHSCSGADAGESGRDSFAVDAALLVWRRKAADVLLIASAAVQLPGLVLLVLGHGPLMAPWLRVIALADYLVLLSAALLRRAGYRARLCAFFFAMYLWVAAMNFAAPRGPYAEVGVVALPILVLVLFGTRAARIAILASSTIYMSAAFLRVLPGVARTLASDPSQGVPASLFRMQTAVLAAWLITLMILLDRFHRFLLNALTGQYRANAAREREAVERQRLEREIAAIGDGERHRLGHELHDGACQQFTAALLHCQVLRQRLQSGEALLDGDFQALSSLLSEGIGEARNIARGLCPLDPDPEALAPALRALTKRIQEMGTVRCEFNARGDVRVPDPAVAQHLYRIAQEALSNAVRHAHASRITVELRGSNGELILLVEDDGAGLPPELPTGGMGLRTMAYRTHMMDGDFTVESAPGGGTRLTCCVPRSSETLAAQHNSGDERCLPTA